MIDERERTIQRRFDATKGDVGPSDWADVQRRATTSSPERKARPARRLRFGGAIATAGALAVGVALLLLVNGGAGTEPASDPAPRSVHLRSTFVETSGKRFVLDQWIDFERRVARLTYPEGLSSPEDPLPLETFLTPNRVFGLVPENLRVRTGGRPWVSAPLADNGDPSASDALSVFDARRFSEPLDPGHGVVVGDVERFVFDRNDTFGGAPVKVYRLREPSGKAPVGMPVEAWVNPITGRLVRTDLGDGQTDVVAYDEPFDTTAPPPDQVHEVATSTELEDILRPVGR